MSDVLSGIVTSLAATTWLAMAASLAAFLLLFVTLQLLTRTASVRPETTRKLLHTGSGLFTLPFPFLFHESWPVVLLTGASALIVAAARFVPAVRSRFGSVASRVDRATFGELYFPLAVAILFSLTRGEEPLLFIIPVLVLTLADTASAVVGTRYGRTHYSGGRKSIEGSVAFAIVAFSCVYAPLLAWSAAGRTESMLVAATLALLEMLLEGSASRGLDNLVVPLGGYLLLRSLLELDTAALLARLVLTVALVFLITLLHVCAARPRQAPRGAAQALASVHLHMKDMTPDEIVELSRGEDDPAVRCDRGVTLMPCVDRVRHAPDRSVLAVRQGSLVARCSCWWRETASLDGARTGVLGHYEASDEDAGMAVLSRACELLAGAGCTVAVGPMDGTTWRPYRFIVEGGSEPPFFLEPQNPPGWPAHWASAGFSPLASYTSAVTHDLNAGDPGSVAPSRGLAAAGISIRAFDTAQPDAELRRIFRLSTRSFSGNLLYSPIAEGEFVEQYRVLLPCVRPELILLAEREGNLVGVVVALPDVLQARRGRAVDTVIVKTVGVDPDVSGMGLGGVLVALAQRSASRLGFRRAVHALMHETNRSRRISDRYAQTFRRYALLSRSLVP